MARLEQLQSLYDQNRFLEAFRQSAHYWKGSSNLDHLSVEELILGSRLAFRLGGWRLSRWLNLAASRRDPSSPLVRYFASRLRRRKRSIFYLLREFETNPDLGTDDPTLQASWCAWHGVLWATFRDFSRAEECIERAHGYGSRDGWVSSCEADVLGLADRWGEALQCAEISWEESGGAPFAAHSLSNSLLHLGRVQEAARRLGSAAETCESFEIAYVACWQHAALADTLEGNERRAAVERARALAEKLPELTPLADRETRSLFARIQLDLAELADDHDGMERWLKEVRSPFHLRMLENLRTNPGGARIRLPFRREIQKHMTCLPASLASALAAMEVNIDPDAMAAELTHGGTADWAAAEWLESRGFEARFFIVTAEVARELIRNGIPFVLSLEADDFSHAVAVVGMDEAMGTLLVHDPQQFRTNEFLLDLVGREAPLGPKGMAAVPAARLPLLEELLPAADADVMLVSRSYHRALQLYGPSVAAAFVTDLQNRHPSHPMTRMLQGAQAAEEGRMGEALASFQSLLEEFPAHAPLRSRVLWACRSLGNTALSRDALEGIVERGLLPGIQSQQEWLHPPGAYVAQYADLLRLSAETRGRSRTLLLSAIRREPSCADAWHVLADLLWHEREIPGALLCYRLASCLAESNEHHASAYSEALAISGRIDEGLAWLSRRARVHGGSSPAAGTWITWIRTLEIWGRPEEALAATAEALEMHRSSPELLSFAVAFYARMGQWDEARALLERLQSYGHLGLYHEAAVDFFAMKGELDASLRHAEAWVRESPLYLRARSRLLDQISARDGARAALERAVQWLPERPGHEGLEELYCVYLDRSDEPRWKKALLLRRRLRRNPEDGWAWRELASLYLQSYDVESRPRRERLAPRIQALLAECVRTAPDDPSTIRGRATWWEMRAEWEEAVALWLESVDRDPGASFGYRRAWECSATLDEEKRRDLWNRLEAILLETPGRLEPAREVIQLAAQRFGIGFAEEAVSRWQKLRPDDPEVMEAASDLLLDHGHGRTDVERALAILEPAVERFPFHLGLRFSLLSAYRKLGRFAEAEEIVREIIRRHPGNPVGWIQLAAVHELAGRSDEARAVLESAIPRDPQNPELGAVLAGILIRGGRLQEARSLALETLQRLPRNVSFREKAIQILLQCGDEDMALRIAREGVALFPRGAYLWFLLGGTLDRLPHLAAQAEVEECLRRSLEHNHALLDAADQLALVLAGQRRYEEAEEVARGLDERLCDPSPVRGRLAWLHREQGLGEAALEEMISVLQAAPWYQWGWNVLMEWLQEDEAWDRARSLLGAVPPEIRTSVYLLRRRLVLLERAGLAQTELDSEWNRLLSDFSEDIGLHLERYDSLRDKERFSEAAAVLRKVQPLDPDNPFLNARLVEVLAREEKEGEAIEVMQKVFFAPVELSEWPASFAWNVARERGFLEEAFRAVEGSLREGSRPTPQALGLWVSYALERESPVVRRPRPVWRTWWPDAGARRALSILDGADPEAWLEGRYRARILNALVEFGYSDLVVRYWRAHRSEVEVDLDCWAQTARALHESARKGEARELLQSWRSRAGVSTWVVATYVLCFSSLRAEHSKEVRLACSQALSALPHDHCARFLAHRQAEACALLDDEEGLLVTWNEHRSYFDGEISEGEWFQADRRHLLEDVPRMVGFLENNQRWRYRAMRWRLRWTCAWTDLRSSRLLSILKRDLV